MIHIITGPPCSGKSTYVKEHRAEGDVVVDFDKMAQALGSDKKHMAPDDIKAVTFKAKDAAIKEVCQRKCEAWIIHTKPTDEQREMYEAAEAEFIEMDTDLDTCLERCAADERPEGTEAIIRSYFREKKGARKMHRKTKTIEAKADNGAISGYAATWIREPDSYGDVIAKGAFIECIDRMKAEGKTLPFLWNHDSYNLGSYIGTVTELGEDDHGLAFVATFDDTPEAQRARELALDGRLCKFSFAYDVLEAGETTLEDGRIVNELRKLNIHEVSLVMYPANPDTSVVEIKSAEKSGRRNSKADAESLREVTELLSSAQAIINSLLTDEEGSDEETGAKSEERDTANDEEQKKIKDLIKEANEILTKGEE